MKIQIVTPAPRESTHGNRITAERWAKLLRQLGHRVSISQRYDQQPVDLLVALHARRSHSSIAGFHRLHPDSPIVLALTGTDVYRDIHQSPRARESLALADRIVVLQPRALRELTVTQRKKAVVIYQSVKLPPALKNPRVKRANEHFDVCVAGHLRAVKDPFRAALAARLLPESSQIRVIQAGAAMTKQMEQRARAEMRRNRRYLWHRALSRKRTLSLMARSKVCVISSLMEGGANVLSEAIVVGTPVLASRIAGNTGILGENYPGLFRAGDTQKLMQLMLRAETDREFMDSLRHRVRELAVLFEPEREQLAWSNLLEGLYHCFK